MLPLLLAAECFSSIPFHTQIPESPGSCSALPAHLPTPVCQFRAQTVPKNTPRAKHSSPQQGWVLPEATSPIQAPRIPT